MHTPGNTITLHAAKIFIVLFAVVAWAASTSEAAGASTIRWAEGKPGCTFTRGEDGKYRYGLLSDDLGITLAVDSRELQRARHRVHPFISFQLTYRYKGSKGLEVRNDNLRLEFVRHSDVMHSTLDPVDFSAFYQNVVDTSVEENEHQIQKHPEKKEAIETNLKA